VFLTQDGDAQLGDFGLAKVLGDGPGAGAGTATATVGTPTYMCPEIVSGQPYGGAVQVDPRLTPG